MNTLFSAVKLWRYALPLRRQTTTAESSSAPFREGLALGLYGNDQILVGIGEIAPLPGVHVESLEAAEQQTREAIRALSPHLAASDNASGVVLESITKELHVSGFAEILLPSVACGIEMALWSLQARAFERHFPENVWFDVDGVQPLNALLTGAPSNFPAEAERAVSEGYTTLKIKVGRALLSDEIAAVRSVRAAIGRGIALRLDANRSWTLSTALRFADALSDCDITYIEEPLQRLTDIPHFAQRCGVKIALDETLYAPQTRSNPQFRLDIPDDALQAYILKPSALGGLSATLRLAREAATRGLDAVLSSVFESGIALGLYSAMQRAISIALYNGQAIACGLDTYKILDDDIIAPRFTAQRGSVIVGQTFTHSFALQESSMRLVDEYRW